jgi:dolichol-phosphate mannosyltransferase
VPTLNEVENVSPLVHQLMSGGVDLHEIVFVDDGSTDGTTEAIRELSRRFPVRLIERALPKSGLADAVLAGARAAEGNLIVVMDADLSHPPENVRDLVAPLRAGTADMVIGSRYIAGGATPGWSIGRRAMSRLASLLASPLTGVKDSMCGFFAISRPRLLDLTPAASGFKLAFEVIVHGGSGFRVREIPIVFRDRERGASKMNFRIALIFALRWIASAGRMSHRRFAPAARQVAVHPAAEG